MNQHFPLGGNCRGKWPCKRKDRCALRGECEWSMVGWLCWQKEMGRCMYPHATLGTTAKGKSYPCIVTWKTISPVWIGWVSLTTWILMYSWTNRARHLPIYTITVTHSPLHHHFTPVIVHSHMICRLFPHATLPCPVLVWLQLFTCTAAVY